MTAPVPSPQPDRAPTDWKGAAMQKRIAARYSAERRFRTLGLTAIVNRAVNWSFLTASDGTDPASHLGRGALLSRSFARRALS
jgi:hypothetical protein